MFFQDPTTFNKLLDRSSKSIAVVVTPLAVFMQELRNKFFPRGLSAEFLGEMQEYTAISQIMKGKRQLVFYSLSLPSMLTCLPTIHDCIDR